MKQNKYTDKINELVNLGLAKIVTFEITDRELITEYERMCRGYSNGFRPTYFKKNVCQTLIRQKIRETYPGWNEIRFSAEKTSSSIWISGNEFTVVIKEAYKKHPLFPENQSVSYHMMKEFRRNRRNNPNTLA